MSEFATRDAAPVELARYMRGVYKPLVRSSAAACLEISYCPSTLVLGFAISYLSFFQGGVGVGGGGAVVGVGATEAAAAAAASVMLREMRLVPPRVQP